MRAGPYRVRVQIEQGLRCRQTVITFSRALQSGQGILKRGGIYPPSSFRPTSTNLYMKPNRHSFLPVRCFLHPFVLCLLTGPFVSAPLAGGFRNPWSRYFLLHGLRLNNRFLFINIIIINLINIIYIFCFLDNENNNLWWLFININFN